MSLPLFTVALKTFEGSQRRWCKKSIGAGRWTLSLCTDQMVTWTSLEVLWIVNSIRIDELQELIVLSIHWPQRKTPSKTASTAMRSLVTDRWRWSTGCTENCVLKTALSAPPSPQGRTDSWCRPCASRSALPAHSPRAHSPPSPYSENIPATAVTPRVLPPCEGVCVPWMWCNLWETPLDSGKTSWSRAFSVQTCSGFWRLLVRSRKQV